MEALILSYGQDTNGQNARFVAAARRHGKDHAVIRALAIGRDDPAGVVGRYQLAASKLGTVEIRSAHRVTHYFDFPGDIIWTGSAESQIKQLIAEADVIHLNNSFRAVQRFRIRKPMLLHHHGSMFRNNTAQMLAMAKANRVVQAVSTLDLTRPDPTVLHWLPTAYDVAALQAFGQANRREPDDRIRIVHAPTNRAMKHTDLLIAAVRELQAEGLPVDLVMVEGKTNAECLLEKARADIVFDQLLWGYGCNSVEAWALGVPVISGADPWTLNRMSAVFGGALPFAETHDRMLTVMLRMMVESADMRAEYAGRGMAHVLRWHDEVPALARLAELYALAIKTYGQPARAAVDPVTFRKVRETPVRLLGETIPFVDGVVTVTDPDVISRLRYFARSRPMYGISEVVA